MAIKDLFEKPQQVLSSADSEKTTKGKVESIDNLDAVLRQKEEFVPYIDHSSASNFAIYGSAEKYYEDAFTAIYRQYPYDGSAHEKKEYELNINYLTRYILDNKYPRTNGYITLGLNNTYSGLSGSYGNVASSEYIKVVGGPHTASNLQYDVEGMIGRPLYETFKYSNKLASNPYELAGLAKGQNLGSQLSNLRFNASDGMTVEFWLKKTAFDPTKTKREVVFDLWNGKNHVGADPDLSSGRFLIELSSSDGGPFRLTCVSGSTSLASDLAICSTSITGGIVANGGWNHYAVSLKSYPSSNETLVKFYVNGDLDKQTTISGYINEVTGGLNAYIGALQTGTALGGAAGYGLLSASLDEFRYWKEARTSEDIGRNWWTQVNGGSNTETANTSLGVYYKFNEGIVQTSAADTAGYAFDKKILDYSGRVSNGVWVGYPGLPHRARSTNSAIVEANVAATEFKDPILYSTHTRVKNLRTELMASGSMWDDENNASLLNALPSFMREEDEEIGDGTLTNTLQMMGAYFDKIHHLIDALPKVRATSYLTASAKPYPFATHLLESIGLNAPELFVQANVLESFAQRDEDRPYTQDLTELKNLIYQNIYNNLTYIYKSKGTEKSIRNIVRCFGVDEELIRLNLYSSNLTYELKDNTRTKTVKSKCVNFNDVDKFDSTIYQAADPDNANTSAYITGSGPTTVTASLGKEDLLGMTVEGEFIFPIKLTRRDFGYFDTPFTKVSLFGMHTPTKNGNSFDTKDYANFQVQAIKPNAESNHAYFKLTSNYDPYPIPELTSSLFNDVYDNQRWNLSVRIKPLDPVTNFVQDNQVDTTFNPLARMCQNYEVHFYGVNMETGYPEHTFHLSGTMEAHKARDFLRASKKIYAGAHKQNFNGATIDLSDVKVSNIKYWATCLDNEDLLAHASDPENHGVTDPYKNVALQVASLNKWHIPKIDTLALNWTFENCVAPSSDAGDPSTDDSFFFVDDISSGSSEAVASAKYGWFSNIIDQQHSGKGDRFLPPESGDKNPIDVNYISSARRQLPEVVNTNDAVQILRQDDDKFTREHSIVQHYYAIEKSMYQTISEEMINMFASIVDFNNLIGEPVNRYRQEYKDLGKLRQLFFDRIGNTPSLDKYVQFYKWLDSAVTTVIQELIPASAEVAADLHNMVESHVLERNKYWTKFPTIEFKQDDPEAGLRGVMELTYDWEHGHHPVNQNQANNALYWKERAERDDFPLSVTASVGSPFFQLDGNPVDGNKNTIRRTLNTHREAKKNSLARPDGTLYGGREYSLRKFTKPYKLEMDMPLEIKSGINFEKNKNVDIAKNLLHPNAPLTISSSTNGPLADLPTNVMFVDGDNIDSFKDVSDDLELNKGKRKYTGTVIMGREKEFDQHNNETYAETTYAKVLPATIVSSSVVTGYNKVFAGVDAPGFVTGASITNIHHDFYGQDREIPMQGPFTEKYVGGHQSRHVRLNPGTDDFQNRPEAWRILVGKVVPGCSRQDPGAFGFVGQDYPYPVIGKEPIAATGIINCHIGSDLPFCDPADGDTITISDGRTTSVFEFDTNGSVVAGNVTLDISGVSGGANSRSRQYAQILANAINAVADLQVQATDNEHTITLVNTLYGAPSSKASFSLGAKGNAAIVKTPKNSGAGIGRSHSETTVWRVTGMAGGQNPVILNQKPPRAVRYREELIKRPVNFKNIRQTTASVDVVVEASRQHGPIGNYTHNYEIVQSAGRTTNDLDFRKTSRLDHQDTALAKGGQDIDAVTYSRKLLQREITNEDEPQHAGGSLGDPNFWHRNAPGVTHSTRDLSKNPRRGKNKTVIVSRFSAPGGYESMSRGFLDPAHEEHSPYDVVTFRNRAVRGEFQYIATSGSVPENFKDTLYQDGLDATTFRVVDIHGEPWGLKSHLTRYTAPYGRDSVLSHGPLQGTEVLENETFYPGFHKVHRNGATANDFTTDIDRVTHTTYYGVPMNRGIVMASDVAGFTPSAPGGTKNSSRALRYVTHRIGFPIGHPGTGREFTMAVWIYPLKNQSNRTAVWALGDRGLGGTHMRDTPNNRPACHMSIDIDQRIYFSINDPLTHNQKRMWYTTDGSNLSVQTKVHNIVLSYDGSSTSNVPVIYVDGVAKALTETPEGGTIDHSYQMERIDEDPHRAHGSTSDTANGIIVGGGPSAGATPSNTHLSFCDTIFMEAALWATNLSAAQVTQIYANGYMPDLTSSTGGIPTINGGSITSTEDLVSWWRFGDQTNDPGNPSQIRQSGSTAGNGYSMLGTPVLRDVAGLNNIAPMYKGNAITDSQNKINYANIVTEEASSIDLGALDISAFQPAAQTPAYSISTTELQHTTNFFTKLKFDNYWVQHQIPRNHSNYSWIKASLITGFQPVGFPTSSDALAFLQRSETGYNVHLSDRRRFDASLNTTDNAAFSDIQGTSFTGLNTVIAEPVNVSTNTLGHPVKGVFSATDDDGTVYTSLYGPPLAHGMQSTHPKNHLQYLNGTFIPQVYKYVDSDGIVTDTDPFIFNSLIHNRQGPYGWPSWKQIRGADHPVVRAQKKENMFSFVLPDALEIHLQTSTGHRVIRPRYGDINVYDRVMPVTSKFKPISSTINVSTKIRNSFGKDVSKDIPIDISTTYGNELVYFNREKVNKKLNLSRSKVAAYEEVKAMFTKGALESSISPVTSINKFVYKETIYPSHDNMYSGDVRIKQDYSNNFWRATHAERTSNNPKTIHGQAFYGRDPQYLGNDNLGPSLTHFGTGGSVGRPSMSIWPLDEATGAMDNLPNTSYRAKWANGSFHSDWIGKGEGELLNRWSWPIKWDQGYYTQGTGYPTSSVRGDNSTNNHGTTAKNRLLPEATACYYMPHFMHATSSITSPTGLPLVSSTASAFPYTTSEQLENVMSLANASGINPAQAVQGVRVVEGIYTTEEWNTDQATAGNLTIQPLNQNSNYAGFVPMQSGYTAWQAGKLAGVIREVSVPQDGTEELVNKGTQFTKFVSASTDPWYSSYDEFYNDIRVKAKDYSVLPEFRMEDHIGDYINNKGGDFLAEQNSLFRMVGMPSGSNELAANSSEDNFYKIYGTSDFLKHFDILKNDIEEHFQPSSLTLKCNAVLKFNPYDGFYPAQRTLQLASQFSASYGRYVEYEGPGMHFHMANDDDAETSGGYIFRQHPIGETAGVTTNLAFRNFLSPLFSPGIMFNTIKAGIACDWPVMTEGVKIYKTRSGKSDYWGLGFSNPHQDDELHDRFDALYGVPNNTHVSATKQLNESNGVLQSGIFKIREDLRKGAISESLIVQSASIAGISDGFRIIEPEGKYNHGGDETDGGFYATKINVADLPGMQATSYTLDPIRDDNSLVFTRIKITASYGPGPNMGRWDKRIPFEAMINPENYLKNIKLFDYIAHPSCSLDVTASWQGQGDELYSMMANNFLAAVPDFFLKNNSMTTISSKAQDELNLYAEQGTSYGMRIKMYRSLNRERNYNAERARALRTKLYDVPQDPRDDHGLHETFTMYSRASAFGPPIFGRTHCVRNAGNPVLATDPNPDTLAQAIASKLTASYSALELGNIFSDLDIEILDACGTQRIPETLFHTASFHATTGGVLDSVEGYYWSHTPPYYHGEAWCDLIFKPKQSKTYSLAEIVDQLEVRQYRVDPGFEDPTGASGEMNPQFIPNGFHSSSLYSAENINANAMQIDSSVNLFGIGKVKTYAYNNVGATGRASATTVRRTTGDSPAWIIQPKFETPMLNFSSLTPAQGGTCPRPLTDDILETPLYGAEGAPRGMWHQFGTLPQGSEGVYLSVGDIPSDWLNNHPLAKNSDIYAGSDDEGSGSLAAYKRAFLGDRNQGMKSLSDLVGMDTTPQRLGTIKETMTVYEAVVAVPFVLKDNLRWFFTLDPHMVDVALGEESYRIQDGSDEPGVSIAEQLRKMQKYVFPPQFDFLNNRELTPMAMYIFEFSMKFSKDDLSYMWQNLLPPTTKKFEMASANVHHNLLINELMGYANREDAQPLKDNIQWMVFKVKQRAPVNYYDKIIAKTPELDRLDRISRSRQVNLGTNSENRYSFNWPYDCFSIVEMAQLEATVEFAEASPSVSQALKFDPSGGRPSRQGAYGFPIIPNQTPPGLIQNLGGFSGVSGEGGGVIQKLGRSPWTQEIQSGDGYSMGAVVADNPFGSIREGFGYEPGGTGVTPYELEGYGTVDSLGGVLGTVEQGAYNMRSLDVRTYETGVDALSTEFRNLALEGSSGPIFQGPAAGQALAFEYDFQQGAVQMNSGMSGINSVQSLATNPATNALQFQANSGVGASTNLASQYGGLSTAGSLSILNNSTFNAAAGAATQQVTQVNNSAAQYQPISTFFTFTI